jgi:aspartyl-tRNA(Asn)/glutamyl-tRNA(Gln) amidotransferase subunit B
MINLIEDGTISGKIAKEVLVEMYRTGKAPAAVIEEKGLVQISDSGALESAVAQVLAENPAQVEEFRAGKDKVIGFLVGQIMKATQGKANPKMVNEILRKQLAE